VDLETLKKYSQGELTPREFLAVHRQAGELLDLLYAHLATGEHVVTVADWPSAPRVSPARRFLALKTMLLLTPLVLIGGSILMFSSPRVALLSVMSWLLFFAIIAALQLIVRARAHRLLRGESVLVVTNHRLMRVWLDGSSEIQSFAATDEKSAPQPVEAVPETVRLLLQVDLGKTSLN